MSGGKPVTEEASVTPLSSPLFHPFDPTKLTPTSPPGFPASRPRFHTRGRGRIGAGDIFLGHTTFLLFSDFLKTDKTYIT